MREDLNSMSLTESIQYIRNTSDTLKGIDDESIKDIHFDYKKREFVLLNDGTLLYQEHTILDNVKELWMQSLSTIYAITNNNEIICINNDSPVTKYINNNGCKYKKLIHSVLFLIGLTVDGHVRVIYTHELDFGIDIDRFSNVEDIDILADYETGIDFPVIKHYGCNEYLSLLILDE